MRVSLIKEDIIKDLILPEKIYGSYWLTDYDKDGTEENLVNIEATENGWRIVSNDDVFCIVNDRKVPSIILKYYNFYSIKDQSNERYIVIYCSPIEETNLLCYELNSLIDGITIGNDQSNDIVFISDALSNRHARISLVSLEDSESASNNRLLIKTIDQKYKIKSSKWGVYVNNKRVLEQQVLNNGDVIFIMGLKIIIAKLENKYICYVNNPNDQVFIESLNRINRYLQEEDFYELDEDKEMNLYVDDDYFHKKPRFINKIEALELNVDAPPTKENDQGMSVLLTIGPMLTMSMTSLVTGYTAVNNVVNNGASWSSAMPSLVICGAMFLSMFLWPLLTKAYEKHRRKKNERERQVKYSKYIDEKRKVIQEEVKRQSSILVSSFPTTYEVFNMILRKDPKLWERRAEDEDFLTVNLGIGQQDMKINIRYPEEHFSLVEDNLKDIVNELGKEPKKLNNVPIELSLLKNNILGIIGASDLTINFMSQLLLQLMAFHSYDDLKIVLLCNSKSSSKWDFLRVLPHVWNDEKTVRYFSVTSDEHKEICYQLERIYMERNEKKTDHKNFTPHYLIITDSFKSIRNLEFIKKILDEEKNVGFSLVVLDEKVLNLPDQCQVFINISLDKGTLFNSLLNNQSQEFLIDQNIYDYYSCSKMLANIPIEIDKNKTGVLPDKIGFLQMYNVGKIEQLNIENRWENNNPVLSLGAPVGFGKDGEKLVIDLHEKYHGPHGLVAGMTGSGKSEFIITYILSMAINYHPYEVQFILIDYKGGGLAGAFENSTTSEKLPHLVGTITNLDTNEIKRSLASIESELKRRQRAFNKARELSGESTVDIYKYQRMYRDKVIDEPVSHLFIICDEFAELKSDQPDFMDQLISTARIGRSLGVHLILATQKPSGVVDPQIWSNTRFRVCLRVQEKSDSSEVIKCPDAAFLKQTGRFYFQVGFNEIFLLGQAAWAGGQYIPSERIRKPIDTTINFINDTGYVIKTVETKKKQKTSVPNIGEELSNIVKYLYNLSFKKNINCVPLWLEKIPAEIFITDLIAKYNYQKEQFMINPVIGEYDDPNRQMQNLLTLPLTKEGNTLIYGISGSGKENFINTIVYSSMLYYSPDEINYYILDFGAETLKSLKKSPIVGDVLTSIDDEKITNLYKMINNIIETRKKLFADYNGSYLSYCKSNDKYIPSIVIIINNYEAYQETFPDFEEELIVLTRDCIKYGIYFIATVTTPNGMRFKIKQNFNQVFVLGQNNEDDYVSILGNVKKTYPSKLFGRGIIKKDSVYEFQTALVSEIDEIQNKIKEKCEELQKVYINKANEVPVLPDKVTYHDIAMDFGKTNDLIIGLGKDSLGSVFYNYTKNFTNIITSLDISLIYPLILPIVVQLLYLKNNVVFINADDYIFENKYKEYIIYEDIDFNKIFDTIYDYVNKDNKGDNRNIVTVIINGVYNFENKLNDVNKSRYKDVFSAAKEMGLMKFILIDSVDNIRKLESETWYRASVNANNGIWVGSGINEQYSLKVTQRTKDLKEEIPDNFAFVLNRGKPTLIKIIEEFNVEE